MTWFYGLPNWLAGVVVVGLTVVVALVGHRAWLRMFRADHSEERRGLALEMMEISALILSLLIAFTAVAVWEAYAKAEDAVDVEAAIAGELARDLAVYSTREADAAREALRTYIRSIIVEEWPVMAKGGAHEGTAHKFNAIFRRVALIEPRTPREEAILREVWTRTNELNQHRRGRLDSLDSAIPGPLWAVVIAGTLVTFFLFYVQPVHRFNSAVLAAYASVMGMVFFFILAMDRPFSGTLSVSREPFENALRSMERWDREPPLAPAAAPKPAPPDGTK